MKNYSKHISGLTLIEIMIGIVITTIMMAAVYTSYSVVNQSYSQVSEKAKISRASRDIVSMLMRDVRMAGFKYYAGSHEIAQFADDTSACNGGVGVALPKNSYLYYDNGFLDPSESHNPVVIRRNTLGFGIISAQGLTTNTTNTASVTAGNCCDQIQIVYEDFNQSHHREGEQPYKKYRITYYALPNDTGGYAAWKRVEHYFQPRVGCSFFTGATPPPQDDGNDGGGGNNSEIFNLDNQFGVGNFGGGIASSGVSDDADDVNLVVRGTWATNCNACTPGTMVRDNIDDMEFIPFDENGKIIQTDAGVFPAPEHIGIRDRLLDIRGVDIRLTFASKDDFFQKAATTDNPRVVLGLAGGNRNNTIADGLDRKLRDSVIVTVHTRNIGETF
ncbi:PilW family protein [Candidatus Pelagibacter sp.]|uniref:PilW family protein n=1 Tax=Candidatus Pelagibacter sp. TaxID=2024849 RepID=UPI003F8545E2